METAHGRFKLQKAKNRSEERGARSGKTRHRSEEILVGQRPTKDKIKIEQKRGELKKYEN